MTPDAATSRLRRRLLASLLPAVLVATAACLLVAGLLIRAAVWNAHVGELRRDLETRTRLVAVELVPAMAEGPAAVDRAVKLWARGSNARLTLVAPDGTVLGDSQADPATMESHADRPEIRQARALGSGWSVRESRTLGVTMLYVARPLGDGPDGPTLRAALPVGEIDAALAPAFRSLAFAGLAILAVVTAAAWAAMRTLARPLRDYEEAAGRFAAGDFSRRLPVSDWRELARLGEALNDMARQLDERVRTVSRQASEQQAVLSSMSEGVLAVDAGRHVISMNGAAARMLRAPADRSIGRTFQEVVRHPDLEALILRVLETGEGDEAEVVLRDDGDRHVHVHCTVLRDASGAMGAVAVLNDLTRVRRLEAVRRDFVANVSHELKTPVTSIQGFIETLRDDGLRDPERARRHLDIVARQAERLSAIIEDLLTLSRLEQEGKEAEIPRRMAPLGPLVESALQVCEFEAQEKGTPLRMSCPPDAQALINPPLLEQALVNLVDNAVKHSDPGDPIDVTVERRDGDCVISVVDRGCGIDPEHLPRLFERFYRVDRARSRKEGGTGLGLSIVKHIARVHGGSVTVDSTPGEGSTFRIVFPAG